MMTPENEDAIWNTLAEEERRRNSFSATSTPQMAQRVGQIHNQFPFLDAGVKLSAAKANLTDEQVLQIAKSAAKVQPQLQEQKKKQKGFFERNFTDKIKTASRYTFSALNLPTDLVQNAASQIFDDKPGFNGWFISTDLGSLIANDTEAGSGYFSAGKAKELQAKRAREFRGTVNGEAFTIGRGLASTFLTPDSTAYRLMSGAFDAGLAIAVPAVPGAKQAGQAIRAAEAAGEGGKVVETLAGATRLMGAGAKEIGATKLTRETIDNIRSGIIHGDSVDYEAANRFFKTGTGRRIVQRTAETKDFAETWNLWGKKIDPGTALDLANAKTEKEVMDVLLDKLGTSVTSTQQLGGTKRVYLSLAQRNKMLASMPFGEGVSRAWAKMPQRSINLFQAESPKDQIDQLNTVDRTLALFKVNPEKRAAVINAAGELLVTKDIKGIDRFYKNLEEVAKKSMEEAGANKNFLGEIYGGFQKYREDLPQFSADDLGNFEDHGIAARILSDQPNAGDLVVTSPLATTEMALNEFHIPDPRLVRRLSNNWNWLWVKKDPNLEQLTGQLRMPFAVVENIQEKIWRPFITATIGNFTRNVVDSQVSIALSGKKGAISPFVHPFQYMTMLKNSDRLTTIVGNNFDEPIRASLVDEALTAERTATRDALNAQWQDPVEMHRKAAKIGTFKAYQRTKQVSNDFARAHGDELGRISGDWSIGKLAGRNEDALSVDEIIARVRSGTDAEATKWYETVKNNYGSGVPIRNKVTGEETFAKIDLSVDQNLRIVLEGNARRLEKLTGNDPALIDAIGRGLLPPVTVKAKDVVGDIKEGARVIVKEFDKRTQKFIEHQATVTNFGGRTGDVEVRYFAWDGMGDNTIKLEGLLRSPEVYGNANIATRMVGEVRNPDTPQAATLKSSMDRMVRKFHATLYDQPTATLERSPLFRSLYYNWVDKLAISMDHDSVIKIIDDVMANSGGKNPEQYLPAGLWKKLNDFKDNPNKLYGTINREQVNAFAAGNALDEMEKMLYNATERRNFTDVMRVISPFAQQQAEFLGRVGRTTLVKGKLGVVPNPQSLRKLQLIIDGGKEADPDGDGRGFFFTDPTTGQWSFSFPLSGELTKLATGISAPITAPVKGIVLGLDVRPGLGPFATVAASQILQDTPNFDFARNILTPYGERNDPVAALVPTWLLKIKEGIQGKEGGKFFANTYVETMQALSASGKYELSNPDEQQRLLNDARTKAQMLTVLRGVTQFTGPASGKFDMDVPTEQGDIHATGLAYALQNLRDDNYDTATLRFIEIFGEDAFNYLSNKSVSEVGGLEASKEFFDFQRNNDTLFAQYKDIAGYFGPSGTEFHFEAYTRQLETGQRRKLTAKEVLDASQRAIGLAYYKDMRSKFGGTLGKDERLYLNDYKEVIKKRYPGFANMTYDPQKIQRQIDQLFQAAKSDGLQDNSVAQATNYYEEIRANALAEANKRGFTSLKSEKLADLHEYLSSYAAALVEKYPDFARVYDRLLSQEIE